MALRPLDPSKQFCFNPDCPDHGLAGQGNMSVHRHKERRDGCRTCKRTFVETKGTMFYRLRTPPGEALDAIAQLTERGSIRGVARAKGKKPDTVIDWLRWAGKHAAQVNEYLLRGLHLTHLQGDELWTFVKRSSATSRLLRKPAGTMETGSGTPGSGKRWMCPADGGEPATLAMTAAKRKPGNSSAR